MANIKSGSGYAQISTDYLYTLRCYRSISLRKYVLQSATKSSRVLHKFNQRHGIRILREKLFALKDKHGPDAC